MTNVQEVKAGLARLYAQRIEGAPEPPPRNTQLKVYRYRCRKCPESKWISTKLKRTFKSHGSSQCKASLLSWGVMAKLCEFWKRVTMLLVPFRYKWDVTDHWRATTVILREKNYNEIFCLALCIFRSSTVGGNSKLNSLCRLMDTQRSGFIWKKFMIWHNFYQCCASWMFFPGSRVKDAPDPGSKRNMEIWSRMFIPDPDFSISVPGSRGLKKGTGSRDPDPQHCFLALCLLCQRAFKNRS